MKTFFKSWKFPVFLSLFWVAINAALLGRFPTVYIDEAENANHAYNVVTRGQALFSLYDDLYPQILYNQRHSWPVVIRPFYSFPLAGALSLWGFSLEKARLFSLLAGFVALWVVYAIGYLLKNKMGGSAAMLLLATRFVFLYCADRIRPEIVLTLCGLIVFLSVVLVFTHSEQFAWLSGCLAGLSLGIHTNGIVLVMAVIGVLLWEKRGVSAGRAAIAASVGLSIFVLAADWESFLIGYKTLFINEFAAPALLKFHGNVLRILALEWGRYFSAWQFQDWSGGALFHMVNGWQYAAAFAAVAWGCLQRNILGLPARFAALCFVGYVLCVGQKSFPYISLIEPYFCLASVVWFFSKQTWDLRRMGYHASLMIAILPLGKVPAIILGSFAILPKKYFQVACLGVLLSFFYIASEFRGQMLHAIDDFRTYWFLPVMGCVLAMFFFRKRALSKFTFDFLESARAIGLASGCAALLMAASISLYQPHFESLCSALAAQMPKGSRVVAPQSFWLGLYDYDFRDSGALVWHHYLLGEKNLLRPLEKFRPDYLVLDESFVQRLVVLNQQRHAGHLQSPTGLFPWSHRVLAVYSAGPAYGGRIALIQNKWPVAKR